jgi:hypothetical protein
MILQYFDMIIWLYDNILGDKLSKDEDNLEDNNRIKQYNSANKDSDIHPLHKSHNSMSMVPLG